MARSAALNPASMPFFPGGNRSSDEESSMATFGQPFRHTIKDQDRSSVSSALSISSSEYRSAISSPSPPHDSHLDNDTEPSIARVHSVVGEAGEGSRQSPNFRQVDANRPYHLVETHIQREPSKLGSFDDSEDHQDTPGPIVSDIHKPSYFPFQMQDRERSTPPMGNGNINAFHAPAGAMSTSSPASSLDSGSQFAATMDMKTAAFEAQLKASPMIHDLLDRLVRCEYTNREVQRDLGDVQRKVNLILERSMGPNLNSGNLSSLPEFKDPFARAQNGPSFSSPPMNIPRPSIGNLAPNQPAPSDDITTISQRLNTLTSSVGQLLAIQTQQMQTNGSSGRPLISGSNPQLEMGSPPMMSNPSMLGHGIPHRPDLRTSRGPNAPVRTWSTGTLDLPMRPPDINGGNVPRDKRRSVSGLLRRDSATLSDQTEAWARDGNRESGPVVSKWDQLTLAPDLLRALGKFGIGPPNKIQQRALPFLLKGADIIAQAPPTQERIAAYVIPAIQIVLNTMSTRPPNRGPIAILVSTTVDQATQAQRMIRDIGATIGVRSALGVGAAPGDLTSELRTLQQNLPHIICGTPQKLHALFTSPGGISGLEVRFLVLDEVDQLIARNLHEFVFNIVKLLPPPRSRPLPSGPPGTSTPTSGLDLNSNAPMGRRFSAVNTAPNTADPSRTGTPQPVERQTALFSNTVPQDVLNLATSIQLREPVRVLVRRDGNVTQTDSVQSARGLRQFYLYLAFTAGGRPDPSSASPGAGLGIIGSGRGSSNPESVQAREWKLDALADLFDDVDVSQAIVHVGGMTALDSVVYKLASHGLETVPIHGDMASATKLAALNRYRSNTSSVISRAGTTKVLVVYDVQVKDVPQVPLIINYDLPKAVEEYAHRVAPAIAANNYSRAGVVVNFVTATGGDVEMLRSIECFYKIKCPEVPISLRDIV